MLEYRLNLNLYFLFFWIIVSVILLLLYFSKKKNILTLKEIIALVVLLILFGFLEGIEKRECYYLLERFILREYIGICTSLMFLVIRIFPFSVLLFILYKFISSPPSVEIDTDEIIEKVFNQGRFLTAFNTSLPNGTGDSEHGLDYIPFMLHSIDERRKRFKITAQAWLSGTAVLGIIFIIAVFYYSNILLNDKSSGLPKISNELAMQISQTNEIIRDEYGIIDVSHFQSEGINVTFLMNFGNRLKVGCTNN